MLSLKLKMFLYFFFLNISSLMHLCAQESGCRNFENGTFKAIIEEPVELSWQVIRDGNTQIEIFTKIPKKDPIETLYGLIDWIDECSYLFTYDDSKTNLSDTQLAINETGGILIELYDFDGTCILFTSYFDNAGEEVALNGRLCLE